MSSNTALVIMIFAFGVMGFAALISPGKFARQFGLGAIKRPAYNEIRAVYGGLGITCAGLLLVAQIDASVRYSATFILMVLLLGRAAARFISASLDRGLDRIPLFYLIMELIGAGLLFLA